MLPEFELVTPQSVPDALAILADHTSDVLPIAGGTNVIVGLRDKASAPPILMDLNKLDALRGIRQEDGHIVVGACTPIAELLTSPLIAQHGAPLRDAAAAFANPLVRNRATVGGNLVDASPAADMAPPLLALDAEVELASKTGVRCVPLQEFIVGVRKTLRRPDELLVSVRWSVPANCIGAYYKLGLRRADAISVVSAVVMVEKNGNKLCRNARIALGAVAPRPFRAHPAEESLQNVALTPESITKAARLSAETTRPIDDIRGSAVYRRRVTEVIVRRLLTQIAQGTPRVEG